jgi:hypothetical protein
VYSSPAKRFFSGRLIFLWVTPDFSLINSQEKKLIEPFFYTATAIHNCVNMEVRCNAGGTFVVDFHSGAVDKQGRTILPNFEISSFPRIHSPNSNRLYLKK